MSETSAPAFDQLVLQQRRLLQAIKAIQVVFLLLLLVSLLANQWSSAAILLTMQFVLQWGHHLYRRGRYELVADIILWTLTILVTVNMWLNYGLRDSSLMAFPGVLVNAALMAKRRTFWTLLGFMLINIAALAVFNAQGWYVHPVAPATIATAVNLIITLSGTSYAVWLLTSDLFAAFARISDENRRVLESQQEVHFLAHHDALTKLPNRLMARIHFEQVQRQAQRNKRMSALIFIDLDDFKTLNDSLGHSAGDRLLQHVAEQLKNCLRSNEIACRQSGDEFLVVVGEIADADAAAEIASRILKSLALPLRIDGVEVITTCSIGIALFPLDGEDFDTLLKCADIAMYQAKEGGRNTFRLYDPQMNTSVREHLQMIADMRQGLIREEFCLYYQPQFDLHNGHLIGAEALLRWKHPQLGMVSPGVFIPLAEKSGLIIELGSLVLNEACRQTALWRAQGISLVMSINLSPMQMRRSNMHELVKQALQESALPARFLELELTESMMVSERGDVPEQLRELRELGVTLAIDDFGTGYSNLGYLKRLDVESLKIDQSFIRGMVTDADSAAIVRAIIQMADSLDIKTVAEGIEDEVTLLRLQELGCVIGQGFYWSPALPPADFFARWKDCAPSASRV